MKKLVPYLDVILLFAIKTSTFNSPNFPYLEIFGFIRIDFMCFTDKGFLKMYSVFHKKMSFSSMPIIHKNSYYDRYYDILHTFAPIVRQMLI